MDVSFAKEHGKQKAGTYYNVVKKAKMTNNHRTMKARLGIRNALSNREDFAELLAGFCNSNFYLNPGQMRYPWAKDLSTKQVEHNRFREVLKVA